jgi:hypothetical protein
MDRWGADARVGERLTQSGAAVRCHSCTSSLALALLATLGSATAMANPLTCHGWRNANDAAVDDPYNTTQIQLMHLHADGTVITQFIPELVRGVRSKPRWGSAPLSSRYCFLGTHGRGRIRKRHPNRQPRR